MTIQAAERPSLHDTLSAAFDEAKVDAPASTDLTSDARAAPAAAETPKAETAAPVETPKTDSTGRVHAPDGKFAPKTETPKETPAPVTAAPARPKRPDSWKKDYWDHWDKLDPALAGYLAEREDQFLKGVTTYKQEWERVKPVLDALQPYQQIMAQQGVQAPQFVKALAEAHTVLSGQDPQAKLRAFAKFAKDYQIPLEQLLVQGEDGKVYLNQTYFTDQQPAAAQPQMGPQEVEKLVQQNMARLHLQQMVQAFAGEKGADGGLLRPHFDKVRETMDGLLRSGLVQDLQSAYDAALALPKHAELAQVSRQQREDAEKAAQAKAKEEAAARARANIVSPRNQAPTALTTGGNGKKDLRSMLSENFDAASVGSRV